MLYVRLHLRQFDQEPTRELERLLLALLPGIVELGRDQGGFDERAADIEGGHNPTVFRDHSQAGRITERVR